MRTFLATAAAAFAAFVVAQMPTDAHAFEVRVRAEARLEVDVSGAGTVAQVSGALRDDLGRGVPQRPLQVKIDARQSGETLVTKEVHTDTRGQFAIQEELPPGQYEVYVRFAETDHLDGIAVSESVRLEPHSVDVRVFGPQFVFGPEASAFVSARANAGPTAFQGSADVIVGGQSVGRIAFDTTGRGTFDVGPYLEEGDNVVVVRTPGSAYREEAEASLVVRHAREIFVEANIEERLQRLSRGLAIYGTVRDSVGPLPGVRVRTTFEPIVLFDADDVTMESDAGRETNAALSTAVLTDDEGRFVGFIPADRVNDGAWRGTAAFVPPIGTAVTVDAGSIEIDSRAYRWAVNGFGLTAIFVGLLALLGRVGVLVWERFQAWRDRRERERREAEALQEVETIVPVFIDATDEGAPVVFSRNDVGGLVWDGWRKVSIPEAEVELASGDTVIRATADARGRFRLSDVPNGEWKLSVTHYGFMRGLMDIAIPHDGRLSHFRIDVIAVPLKIRRLYGTVIEHRVGEDLFGSWSPREIEERIDEAFADADPASRREIRRMVIDRLGADADDDVRGEDAVAALTEVVEESYFSGRTYGEEAFRFARALALEVRGQGAVPR